MIFYTTGYRFDFTDEDAMIVTTGGVYVSVDSPDVEVYLNEKIIADRRLFQNAFYIQNIQSGKHRLVVQQIGTETWVKEIPVFPYLVTEVAAFNIPTTPRVRLITPTTTADGVTVVAASSSVLQYATSVELFEQSSTTRAPTYIENPEYNFVSSLFAATTTRRATLLERLDLDFERFTFSSATSAPMSSATTTVVQGNMRLFEVGNDLYAAWEGGNTNQIPFYFCLEYQGASSTAEWYGEHVAKAVEQERAGKDDLQLGSYCRETIKLDHKQQQIKYFDFVPGNEHLVLLHLEDGLHVSEIDDRAWQNTQMLYESTAMEVVVEGDQIFIQEDGQLFEIYPTLED